MLYHIFLLPIFGTLCIAKSIHPKGYHGDTARNAEKNFLTQAEDNEETMTALDKYLKHAYYTASYSKLEQWERKNIYVTGNTSTMTKYDDPPPFEVINIYEEKDWIFPFYGHEHKSINIDSNGFVSMVPRLCPHYGFCNWAEQQGNHASQYQRYVAPLMTDFNPVRYNDEAKWGKKASKVSYQYGFNPSSQQNTLTVQWTNVVLFSFHNPNVTIESDGFTFQVVLHEGGDMVFNYKKMPYYPGDRTLKDTSHHGNPKLYPVVMGIEDAVIVKNPNKAEGQPETILADYNPFNFNHSKIFKLVQSEGGATVTLKALPTCPNFKSCGACVNQSDQATFKCGWCQQRENPVCADVDGRESASVSAGCLANDKSLRTLKQCADIGKEPSFFVNRTALWVSIGVIVAIVILLIIVGIGWRNTCEQLMDARRDAKESGKYNNIDKGKNYNKGGKVNDSKVEMSA